MGIVLLLLKMIFLIYSKYFYENQILLLQRYQSLTNSNTITIETVNDNVAEYQTQEYYEKEDKEGWIGLYMSCPVEQCVKIHNKNKKKYWYHPGGTKGKARNEMPQRYPIQFNKDGKLRCRGCHGNSNTAFNYDDWLWCDCDTHDGEQKGMPGYLTDFITNGKFFQ